MAPPKLLLLVRLLSLSLIFSPVIAHVSVQEGAESDTESEAEPEPEPLEYSDSSLAFKIELDQLKSNIQTLESRINKKSQELKKKDEIIVEKEKIILDRLSIIESLQHEIASLEEKGKLDAQEQVGKAHAHAGELQKQVDKLKGELEKQNKEKVTLESQVAKAEKKIHDLNSKLEDLRRINEEQKAIIRQSERALKVTEEEMMKAKFVESSQTKELTEVHGAWLPPWLAVHLICGKSFIETHWNEYGKPALEVITQKTLEKKAQVGKWAEPHLETIKTKWIPALKELWSMVKTSAEPHVQLLITRTVEVCEASKNAIAPHLSGAQEFVDPYYQEAKRFSQPYIDQVAVAVKPHINKVQVVLKPYTKKGVHAYGKFLELAATYHCQVEAAVQETLKKHELTRPFATKELELVVASALLALPIILLARVFCAIFCRKVKKPTRNGNTHLARRRAKRRYPDK